MQKSGKKTGLIAGIIGGVVALIAIIVVVLIIVLNGGNKLVGTWKLVGMKYGSETADAKMLEEMGTSATIEFKSDGTGTVKTTDTSMHCEYEDGESNCTSTPETSEHKITYDKDKKTLKTDDGEGTYEIKDDGKLYLTNDGVTQIYEKK